MTLTPIAERLAVELSLPVLRLTSSVATGIQEHSWTTFRLLGERFNRLRHQLSRRIVKRIFVMYCYSYRLMEYGVLELLNFYDVSICFPLSIEYPDEHGEFQNRK